MGLEEILLRLLVDKKEVFLSDPELRVNENNILLNDNSPLLESYCYHRVVY